VLAVLACMKENGLSLFQFLEALSWGDRDCTVHPTIASYRREFLHHDRLLELLQRWRKPPRPPKSTKRRAQGGKKTLEEFALSCTTEIMKEELTKADRVLRPKHSRLRTEDLT
ncbi:hypothetical protein BV20DRAFT_927317, partial [Pilatotrama ljubarskyi]